MHFVVNVNNLNNLIIFHGSPIRPSKPRKNFFLRKPIYSNGKIIQFLQDPSLEPVSVGGKLKSDASCTCGTESTGRLSVAFRAEIRTRIWGN